jgi:hypothetical protein
MLRLAERELSKTRATIDDIVRGLSGVRVLEASIDVGSSARKSEHPRPVTNPFDLVLDAGNAVIAYGTDAVAHLGNQKTSTTLIECKHFICFSITGE